MTPARDSRAQPLRAWIGLVVGGSLALACVRDAPHDPTTDTSTSEGPRNESEAIGDDDGNSRPSDQEPGDREHGDAPAPTPECVPAAFVHAPAPVEIDGLNAVPIDILELDAELHFDADAATAFAQGTLRFQIGEHGGMPILDLRQTLDSLTLDGEPIATNLLARHDFGVGWDEGFAILEVALEPCTTHALEFSHALAIPQAPGAAGPTFEQAPTRAYFDFYATDLQPGRYLESWLPANMPWDRHPISLAVSLHGAESEHALISNAAVDLIATHSWQLEFPATTTAMDPMLVLAPLDELDVQTGVHQAANAQAIPYAVYVPTEVGVSAAIVTASVAGYLDDFVVSVGTYAHPAMTVYVYPSGRSMEYAGATTSAIGALEHEIFHSWWARGLSPATYADGWIDEAWDMFSTGNEPFVVTPFEWDAEPTALYDGRPFARDTPGISYSTGRLVFAGLADLMGIAELRSAMGALYFAGGLGSVSTGELERRLYCESGELVGVRQAFHRFVYGLEGEVEPVAEGYCE